MSANGLAGHASFMRKMPAKVCEFFTFRVQIFPRLTRLTTICRNNNEQTRTSNHYWRFFVSVRTTHRQTSVRENDNIKIVLYRLLPIFSADICNSGASQWEFIFSAFKDFSSTKFNIFQIVLHNPIKIRDCVIEIK
jgi:hypothetical protein